MADMGDKLRGAGLRVTEEPRRDDKGGGGGHGGNPRDRSGGGNAFPPGYPKYFTDDGYTNVDMLMRDAERIADRFDDEKLKRHQLRAFYDHAKRQLQRLQYGAPFGEVHPQIARLKALAADRAARRQNPIPPRFKEFIDRNIDAVADQKSFEKGFMPHFEAVVGYCSRLREV